MTQELEKYFDRLWPIPRSLTGDGNRESLQILSEIVDLKITEVASGTECFDWKVPPEWNVKEAWIKDERGNKIVDFKEHNLHLLGYSIPFHKKMTLEELKPHLYSLPEQPDLIPYATSYYHERWGFCISYNQLTQLKDGIYEVCIDSKLNPSGSMTVAEAYLEGWSEKEVLLSTYICHPSMANNELSGPLVTSFIYKELAQKKNRRYNYRFLFLPETIGSIFYLSKFGEELKKKVVAGYVVNCIGDSGSFTYKRSRKGNSLADKSAEAILTQTEQDYKIEDFFPFGSDERQYCSPGFDLPVGSLMRTRYQTYPEYHTSGDNKELISFDSMKKSVEKYLQIIEVLEKNFTYLNVLPHCEPQLGKRGLYPTIGKSNREEFVSAMMWILNLSDGSKDLLDISKISNIPFRKLILVVETLINEEILKKA